MAWYRQLSEIHNAKLIGETVSEAFEHIKNSPVDARTRKERDDDSFFKHAISHKTYRSFNKNYLLCGVILNEDGSMLVSQTRKLDNNNGYGGDDSTLIHLDSNSSSDHIGRAVLDSFAEMESIYCY